MYAYIYIIKNTRKENFTMNCETCKHNGYIKLNDGRIVGFCRKIAPNIDWDICFDYEEKEIEYQQGNLFEIINEVIK